MSKKGKRTRLIWRIGLFGIGFFIGLQLLFWLGIGVYWRQLLHNPVQVLTNAQWQQWYSGWIKFYPVVSLGSYRAPLVNDIYQVLVLSSSVGQEMTTNIPKLTTIGRDFIGGTEIPLDEWQQIPDMLMRISDLAHEKQEALGSPIILTLVKISGNEDTFRQLIEGLWWTAGHREEVETFKNEMKSLLGYDTRTHFVVLLQNNYELWPTGGYMGSYAEFWLDQGTMKQFQVQDIGVPNGQIKGYVEAPQPIVTYTHQGGTPGWRLRESNWDPDFTQAFPTISWFFTEGGLEPIDGMIGITLHPIIQTVEAIGPVYLPDYDVAVNSENFYQVTQTQAESGFFDGSYQKPDFIGDTAKQLLWKVETEPETILPRLAPIVIGNLKQKQILMTTTNEEVNRLLEQLNISGALWPVGCQNETEDCVADYIYVNEANLGINKTNCCIDRQFSDVIGIDNGQVTHELQLFFRNNNPGTPNPPIAWGGGYQAWTRLHLPDEAELLTLTRNGEEVDRTLIDEDFVDDKYVLGFPVLVPGDFGEATYQITYTVPVTSFSDQYELIIQKQSGVDKIPWDITVNNQGTESFSIDRDIRLEYAITP